MTGELELYLRGVPRCDHATFTHYYNHYATLEGFVFECVVCDFRVKIPATLIHNAVTEREFKDLVMAEMRKASDVISTPNGRVVLLRHMVPSTPAE